MKKEIEAMRKSYTLAGLDQSEADSSPFRQFTKWFQEAQEGDLPSWFEVNAMTLSTADLAGHVTNRIVLLKQFDETGFTFFTNYMSHKGQQLAANPHAALCFFWPHLERQIRIAGTVSRVPSEVSDQYFASRPRDSQLGALISTQSSPLADRSTMETAFQRYQKEFEGQPIPRPDHWGGYLLTPTEIEFWQGRPSRLHDRIRYQNQNDQWKIDRICP